MKKQKQRTVNIQIKEYNSLKRKRGQLLKVKTLVAGSLDFVKKEKTIEAKALLADALRTLTQVK